MRKFVECRQDRATFYAAAGVATVLNCVTERMKLKFCSFLQNYPLFMQNYFYAELCHYNIQVFILVVLEITEIRFIQSEIFCIVLWVIFRDFSSIQQQNILSLTQ